MIIRITDFTIINLVHITPIGIIHYNTSSGIIHKFKKFNTQATIGIIHYNTNSKSLFPQDIRQDIFSLYWNTIHKSIGAS